MRTPLIIAAMLAAAGAAQAQPRPAAPAQADAIIERPPYGMPLTLAQARAVGQAASAEAKKRGYTMSIVIVEPAGDLVWFEKMDDAQYGATDVAMKKAVHSARFRRSTKNLADGLAAGNLALLTVGAPGAEGGLPIMAGGKVIGAIGVSGGTSQQDGVIAAVGVAAVK